MAARVLNGFQIGIASTKISASVNTKRKADETGMLCVKYILPDSAFLPTIRFLFPLGKGLVVMHSRTPDR